MVKGKYYSEMIKGKIIKFIIIKWHKIIIKKTPKQGPQT